MDKPDVLENLRRRAEQKSKLDADKELMTRAADELAYCRSQLKKFSELVAKTTQDKYGSSPLSAAINGEHNDFKRRTYRACG